MIFVKKSSFKIVLKGKITFLLSKTLLFFFEQKYILFSEAYFFKILKNLITSAIFLAEADTKNIDKPRQKPEMLHWQNLLIESLKIIMRLIVRFFSVSDKYS